MKKYLDINIKADFEDFDFNYYCTLNANKLQISGVLLEKINNCFQIEAEGDEDKLDEFIIFFKEGFMSKKIHNIEIEKSGNLKNHSLFVTKRQNSKSKNAFNFKLFLNSLLS